jgi:hypothetical protein
MHRDRDLLPWILSGLLMASLAIAIGAASIESFASKNLSVRNLPAETGLPANALAPVLPAAPPTAAASFTATASPIAAASGIAEPAVLSAPAQLSGAPTQAASRSSEPNGRIWECTTQGVKTFSDNPCGEKSALREVGPINTMAPTPLVRYAGVNAPDPRYMPTYVNENAYDEQDSYSEPAQGESYDSYPVIQGFAYLPRIRALHPHRPIHHHGKPVRRN